MEEEERGEDDCTTGPLSRRSPFSALQNGRPNTIESQAKLVKLRKRRRWVMRNVLEAVMPLFALAPVRVVVPLVLMSVVVQDALVYVVLETLVLLGTPATLHGIPLLEWLTAQVSARG